MGVREDQLRSMNVSLKENTRLTSEEVRLLAVTFETGLATLITDAKGTIVRVNEAFTAITGYAPEEVLGQNPRIFQSGRHDREFYKDLWAQLQMKGYWQGEVWNRHKTGKIYPLWESITAVCNRQGKVRHYVAVFHDISARKQLESSRNSLLEILETTPDFIAMARPDGSMFYINRGGRELTGLQMAKDPLQSNDLTKLQGGCFAHPEWAARRVMKEGFPEAIKHGLWQAETALIRADGEEIPVSQIILAHYNEDGHTTHLSTIMRDISELKRLESQLYYMATHDEQTGLFNRRRFEQCINDEIYRAKRYERGFSLIMFDIDHFKSINDNHGHETGDRVLARLSEVVTSQLRQADVFARWGGEEFMILLPETGLDGAELVAEATRKIIAQTDFRKPRHVTVSLGVTQYRQPESIDSLLTRVDNLLYQAKSEGRNQTAVV